MAVLGEEEEATAAVLVGGAREAPVSAAATAAAAAATVGVGAGVGVAPAEGGAASAVRVGSDNKESPISVVRWGLGWGVGGAFREEKQTTHKKRKEPNEGAE